MKREAFR
jgi:hypothetical protein